MSLLSSLARPLAFIDLETTGTDIAKDRIVELAVLRFEPGGERRQYSTLINPGRPIPAEAAEVHGISDADVANAPTFAGQMPNLRGFLEGADFAGFNLTRFDLPMLRREMLDAGEPMSLEGRRIIDAMTIYHAMHPRNLAAAAMEYLGRPIENAHSAMGDVLATVDVLCCQVDVHDDVLKPDVQQLHEFCGGGEGVAVDCAGKFVMRDGRVVFAFGKHDGKALGDVARTDPSFLTWMLGKDFGRDTKDLCRAALRGGVA